MIQRLADFAAVLPQGFERAMMVVGGSMGGIFTFLYGDAGPLLIWLVVFVILDFLTGTLAAVLNGTWTSKRNALGVLKKMLALCIVALAHGLDVAFCELLPFQIIESITICAYMAGEFGSIIENLDKMGLRVVPPVVRKLIDALNAKLDRTVDKVAESDIKETGK